MLRKEHYDPEMGKFTIPYKSDDTMVFGIIKTADEYLKIHHER